ncbi:hypothetical protein [Chryseobacterium vrystaatense]|uniref:Uncharacterized protein n=1 Tax=Chryseobacterium vrystaatense TaxID=307480 RepID=A0A1M5AMT6_9FLAO|nr:hypothetical protein [Chryseobacterium vrystaatense]KFF26815.1 hypothetical protein IW16_05880 [Chryseobacterium vrystaatense]SHF31454.1 hypothetical protein SAMN02787073_1976 [Chryseobacterium vrystaatense]
MEEYFYVQLVLDLQERIAQEVPEIQYIDQQLGQLENVSGTQTPVIYPALFIDFPEAVYDVDFPEASYSEMSANGQLGTIPISFQLVANDDHLTWHQAPVEERKKGLDYLRIEQKLYQALQGWSMDYFSPLSRTQAKSTSKKHIGFKVRELMFTTQYEDFSASPEETRGNIYRYSFNPITPT